MGAERRSVALNEGEGRHCEGAEDHIAFPPLSGFTFHEDY